MHAIRVFAYRLLATACALLALQVAVVVASDGTPTLDRRSLPIEQQLDLEMGSVATLFAGTLSRFEMEDPEIARAEHHDRLNLRVRARRPGRTSLYVWTDGPTPHRYEVRILPGPLERAGDASPEALPTKGASRLSNESISAAPGAAAALRQTAMDLFVGSVSTMQIGAVERIVVGNDRVTEATLLDDGALLVLGKTAGVTELQVLLQSRESRQYLVRVYPAPPDDSLGLLRTALRPFPDVAIEPKLGRLIVTGTVDSADFERFNEVIQSIPGVLSTVAPRLNIAIEHSVVFDVAVLEVNRNYQRTVGVRWQDTAPGPAIGIVGNLIPNRVVGVVSDVGNVTNELQDLLGAVGSGTQRLSGYLGITSIFGSELQLLQEEGLARVLAAPSLSTVSGEQATFLAGGDFPVAILNQFGQPVIEFREFGVQLEIQPFVDRALNIRSKIRAEVSSVDFSVQVNGVPGLLRRETTSTITARPGETIILSGLLDARDTRNVDKVPGLGSIPIIGQLFRSDDFIKQRTELIITVTPRIQKPNEGMSPTLEAANQHLRKNVLTGSKGIDQALIP